MSIHLARVLALRSRIPANFQVLTACLWLSVAVDSPAQPIALEAEDGTLIGVNTSTAAPGYSGSGYVTGFDNDADQVLWTFNGTQGLHRLQIRFRSPYGEKGFEGTLNGFGFSGMFPQSEAFTTFDAGLVTLESGTNTIEIGRGWKYYEIDRVDLIGVLPPPPPAPVPSSLVDPLATPSARLLMADLAADYGQLTWSGQHESNDVASVVSGSGRKPVIISGDFMNYSPSRIERGADPTGITENMIALEREGYVISFCWHWNAPTNLIDTPSHEWWRGFYTHATTFDVDAALADTNSSEYALLLRDIDAIAIELQKISGAGIPVLWRPLHESEGGWFWWGAKGPEPFKELWRLLYTRLTENHNLHNLIWVLTSEDPAWYPGNDVVDIVGADGYPSDRNDTLSSRWEVLKARFDGVKLLALTEFGGVPDIERMHQFGVWWAYFAPWGGSLGPGSEPASKVGRIYQSAEVLTLDELNARPPMFTSIHTLNGRAVGLQGKGPRGSGWDLLGTSDPTLPAATWPQVAEGTFTGGVFQYIDTTATNDPHRFYRIEKP